MRLYGRILSAVSVFVDHLCPISIKCAFQTVIKMRARRNESVQIGRQSPHNRWRKSHIKSISLRARLITLIRGSQTFTIMYDANLYKKYWYLYKNSSNLSMYIVNWYWILWFLYYKYWYLYKHSWYTYIICFLCIKFVIFTSTVWPPLKNCNFCNFFNCKA